MRHNTCPLCYGPLEVRDVTPCMLCGADPQELLHIHDHTYDEVEISPGLVLVLCNFCQVDIGSYDPTFFGLPGDAPIGIEHIRLVRSVSDVAITKDKYCTDCGARLALLRLISKARETGQE